MPQGFLCEPMSSDESVMSQSALSASTRLVPT
jgi:hypothetical protein